MSTQATLVKLETIDTDFERFNLSQTTSFQNDHISEIPNSELFVANDDYLDTSSEPLKNPSTFFSTDSAKQLSAIENLAEWNGYVTAINNDGYSFSAVLTGTKGIGVKGEEDDATIPISDVSKSDLDLLAPGNFFRLCVMREITPSGQPRRYTQVIFRRLPAYRKQDLDNALERGRSLARSLRVE